MWILYEIYASRNGLASYVALDAVNASKSSSNFCSDALVAVVVGAGGVVLVNNFGRAVEVMVR